MTEELEILDPNRTYREYLSESLAVVRERLRLHTAKLKGDEETASRAEQNLKNAQERVDAIKDSILASSPLDYLCSSFSLSTFERDLLLLTAGVEMDFEVGSLCALSSGDLKQRNPSFALAATAMPGASWRAISPEGPLRKWHLIHMGKGDTLAASPLHIDEKVLHYILGVSYLDERLRGMIVPVLDHCVLPQSHIEIVSRIADSLSGNPVPPLVQLYGAEGVGKRTIAAAASTALGIDLYSIDATDIPGPTAEREDLARLWERETILSSAGLMIDCRDMGERDLRPAISFLERINGMAVSISRQPLRLRERAFLRIHVHKPRPEEQVELWHKALSSVSGEAGDKMDAQIDMVVSQFNLAPKDITRASYEVLSSMEGMAEDPGSLLWKTCRDSLRFGLDGLAQRIMPAATWEDLVLPSLQLQILREIGAHVRQSAKVYRKWGFASKGSRGLGISALFAGESGTGKTMAAEVLANDLELDLYRIDLSNVVSKYIGETEKNLARVFDAAEGSGSILLFDEADALFGKRSEVKDSHDRYANIEVGYLLQRMESYRGLAILTTNIKSALDRAFIRRIRFIVQFPFPGETERSMIWSRIFPKETPTEGLDIEKLARLNIAGGSIRNIAIYAAFLAAEEDIPVNMGHLLRAAKIEYGKLERPMTGVEIGGWI
jgi:AAA+ superfamily predicted ATPase